MLACLLGHARAKTHVSVLGAYVEGRDSAYSEGLSRDLAQALAEDTSMLVFDIRKKNGAALDSAHAAGTLRRAALLAPMNGRTVKWGLLMECAELKEEYRCRLEALDMDNAASWVVDTLHVLLEAGEKRKPFAQAAARGFASHFKYGKYGKSDNSDKPDRPEKPEKPDRPGESGPPAKADPAMPSLGSLKLRVPANPAMLIRGLAIVRKGSIAEIPVGTTLVIGDAPGPIVLTMENVHFVLYPHSSYTYLLPKVVQLNSGALGIIKGADTASLEGRLRPATALDQSNLIWKALTRLAALDSGNLVWQGLGKAASLDSHDLILKNLRKSASMDTGNPLYKTLDKVTAMDGGDMLLRTLSRVAAMDSSSLVWKGLGRVSALDSADPIWRKLGEIASLDSNSIWRKLGLLAFQDESVVLTPSFIVRGQPQAVMFRHEGSISAMEVVKGSMSVQPLLSSQEAVRIGAMRVARTRGYSLKQERLNPSRGDRIIRGFEAIDPSKGGSPFAMFLPGKLFGAGSSLRTADRSMQAFMVSGARELDMEMDLLSSEKEGWADFGATFRSGSQESGCYLCSPDKLGP